MGGGASKTGASQTHKVVVRSASSDENLPAAAGGSKKPEATAVSSASPQLVDGALSAGAGDDVSAASPQRSDRELEAENEKLRKELEQLRARDASAAARSTPSPPPLPSDDGSPVRGAAADAGVGAAPLAAVALPVASVEPLCVAAASSAPMGEASPGGGGSASPGGGSAMARGRSSASEDSLTLTAASLPSLKPVTPRVAEVPKEMSFRQALKEGYRQMAKEREAWLRSMAEGGFDPDDDFCDEEDLEATSTSDKPLVGLCGKVLLERRALAANSAWEQPLKDRSADVAEELQKWTQRLGKKDWLPVTEEV